MKVRATDDYDGTYIYDPKDWTGNQYGDFDMEITEEDLERYRKHVEEKYYWEDRIGKAKEHARIMKTPGGYGLGKLNVEYMNGTRTADIN
jgi:hypothetical protein